MAEAGVVTEQEQEQEQQPEKKQEVQRPTRADYERIQADRARQNGWKDFDEYVEAGGDPEKWKTADAFNTYGELIGTVKRQKVEFEQRIEGVQTLAQAQLDAQRRELTEKRDAMIDEGGKGPQVKAIEKQIEALNVAPTPVTPHALAEWNANNKWIDEKTPKAIFARQIWAEQLSANTPVEIALRNLEAEVEKHFPRQTKTTTIPETERGAGPKGFGKAQQKAVTMDSLTSEERNIWKHSAGMWKNDQKAFLQSVADTRKAAQGGK